MVGDGGGSTPDFSVIPWLTFFFGLLPLSLSLVSLSLSTPNFSVIPWLTFFFGLLPDMVISHDI